jgi:hypothetical protein
MVSKHQLARDRPALQATLARTGSTMDRAASPVEMKGAMQQVASQCVQVGGAEKKGFGQEKEEKVRRQRCEEEEQCFIDEGLAGRW